MEVSIQVAPQHSRSSTSSTSSTNDRPHTRRRMLDELLEPIPPLRQICTTATTRVSRGTQASTAFVEVSRHLHNQEEPQQHRIVWNQRTLSEQLQLSSSVWLPSTENSSFLPPPGHRVDTGDDAPLQAPPRRSTNNNTNNNTVMVTTPQGDETRLSHPTEMFSRQQSLLSLDNMSISTELENLYPQSNRSVCSFGHGSTCSSNHLTSAAMVPPHLLRLTSQSSARPSKTKLERQTSTGADSWWSAGTCNSHHLYKPTSEIRLTHHHHHQQHHRSSSSTSIASSYHPGRCRRPTNPMAELMMCQQISSNSQRSLCSSIVSTTTTSCFSTTNVASCETSSSSPPNPPFGTMYATSRHHHSSCTSTTTTTTTLHNHHYNHSEDRAAHHRSSIPMEMESLDGTASPLIELPATPPEFSESYRPPLPLQVPIRNAAPLRVPTTAGQRPIVHHPRPRPERAASSSQSQSHSHSSLLASAPASSPLSSFLGYESRLLLPLSDTDGDAAANVVVPRPPTSSSGTDASSSGRVLRHVGRRGSL